MKRRFTVGKKYGIMPKNSKLKTTMIIELVLWKNHGNMKKKPMVLFQYYSTLMVWYYA